MCWGGAGPPVYLVGPAVRWLWRGVCLSARGRRLPGAVPVAPAAGWLSFCRVVPLLARRRSLPGRPTRPCCRTPSWGCRARTTGGRRGPRGAVRWVRESWRASRPRDSRWCGVAWGGPWPLEGRETAPRPSVVWVVRCSRVRPARSRRGSCGTAGAPRGRSAEGFLHGSRIRAFAGLPSLGAAPPLRAGWWSSVLPPPPVCLVPPRVASSAARLRRLPSAFSPGPPASVSRQPGRPFGVVSLPVRRFPIPVGGFRFRLPPRCVSSAAGPPRPSLPAAPRLTDGVLCFRVCGRDGRGWSYVFGVLRIAAAGPAGVGGRLPGPSPFPRVVPAIPLGGTLAPRGAFALTGLSLLPSSVPHSGTFLGSPTPEKRRRRGGGEGERSASGKAQRGEERKNRGWGGHCALSACG